MNVWQFVEAVDLMSLDNLDEWFANLVTKFQPRLVVELGTGDGYTAAMIAAALPEESYFTTINWPQPRSGDDPWRYLGQFTDNRRIQIVIGDTREESWRFANKSIDLLYIDSTHTYECASEEWRLYQPKLDHGALVVVDDLDHNDMGTFWDSLRYDKTTRKCGRQGILQYTLPMREL